MYTLIIDQLGNEGGSLLELVTQETVPSGLAQEQEREERIRLVGGATLQVAGVQEEPDSLVPERLEEVSLYPFGCLASRLRQGFVSEGTTHPLEESTQGPETTRLQGHR